MRTIASKGKDERAPVTAALARLNGAVPTLVQRLDERLFASHVRDVVAVAQAYLAGELPWAALLTGLEAALFQARACMVDEKAGEALVEAARAVARYAGAAMERAALDCRGPETPGGPSDPDTGHPDSPGGGVAGTGFASSVSNTNSKPKANPKVPARHPKPKPYPKPESERTTS